MQWYSSPNAVITEGSYRLRPSNTTGVRNAVRMASKSGVRNALHSVTMGSALAPRCASAAQAANNRQRGIRESASPIASRATAVS